MEAIKEYSFVQPEINIGEWADAAHSRSLVYGFLAAVYNRLPDERFARSLRDPDVAAVFSTLRQQGNLPDEVREGITLVESYIEQQHGKPIQAVCLELAMERTRLLRGVKPGYGPPPPYESVYMGSENRPNLRAGAAIRLIFAEAGVELSQEVKDQPDFIGFELDFMRYLTEMEAEAWSMGDRQAAVRSLVRQQSFLKEHIVAWVPRFCGVMLREARWDFYRGIARMTRGFVQAEAKKITEFTMWAKAIATT